jgi:two-component system chemotaxis response regulator CheB
VRASELAIKAAAKKRVLVVEDSLTVRKHIVQILNTSNDFEIVGEAGDGKSAIELCRTLAPDVMTMDMMLPVMTGVAATEYIMAHYPTAILIVSSSMNRGEQFRTYDALAAGAVDVLEKPTGLPLDANWGQRLLKALRLVSRIRVIRHPRALLGKFSIDSGRSVPSLDFPTQREVHLVAIGASTGGPGAMHHILSGLSKNFSLPILLVLHIAEAFGPSLIEWLDAQSALPVRYARHGEPLPVSGCVLVAPPGQHLVCRNRTLHLSTEPERHSCRPSVDVLFESLAEEMGRATFACLLTGMGKDGAAGLLRLREAGAHTIAQDEESCVVFGMPYEAIRLGAAKSILPLNQIPNALARLSPTSRLREPT